MKILKIDDFIMGVFNFDANIIYLVDLLYDGKIP